ncbi:CHAP domain-containing protein [Nocardioides montaniterrae]
MLRHLIRALLAATLLLAGLTTTVPAASALESVDAFVSRRNGQFPDYDGQYGSQCVDLFEYYNRDVVGAPVAWGNAYQLYGAASADYYDKYPAGSGYTPVKGDVAVWNTNSAGSGGNGHVAIVLGVVNSTTLQVFQANSSGTNDAGVNNSPASIGNHGTANLTGYLHPKNLPGNTPPPPPDRDQDAVADSNDLCPDLPGWSEFAGCPEEIAAQAQTDTTTSSGDGSADYCRLVGNGNGQDSHVQCTLGAGNGFGVTRTSDVLDWGYRTGRAWVDVNGDRRADFCRRVGNNNNQDSHVACTLSTATGFGATWTSGVVDWGYDFGRAWVDVNGDHRADFCRVVGNTGDGHVQCTLATSTGFGATRTSPVLDWGYALGRFWVDVNGDHRADYCRRVGNTNNQDSHVACTLSTATGFGATWTSGVLDWGYDTGRAWADVNGDHRADYCRVVGGPYPQSYVSCTLTTSTGFGATRTSPALDWGYAMGRTWTDVNGDHRADYCRRVGNTNNQDSHVACILSTATGFGATWTSGVVDWGYDAGRTWADVNGDHRADYCRVVGNTGDGHTQCTLATATGFGATVTSPALDWGYDDSRMWSGQVDSTSPTAQLVAPTATSTTLSNVTVRWTAVDWGTGLRSSTIRVQSAKIGSPLGPWYVPSGSTAIAAATRSHSFGLVADHRYCFSVRSTDRSGNVGAWSTARCISRT